MFTWICPQCGREVPPSYNECPDCAVTQKTPAAVATPPAPPPPQPAARPAPDPLPDLPRTFASASPAPRATPAWLIGTLSAIGAIVVVVAVFWAGKYFSGTGEAAAAPAPITMEKPGPASPAKAKGSS